MLVSCKEAKLIEEARNDEDALTDVCTAILPKYAKSYCLGNSQEFIDHVIDNTVYNLSYLDTEDHTCMDEYDLVTNIEYWLWYAYCTELADSIIDGNRRLWPNLLASEAHDLIRAHRVHEKACDLTLPLDDCEKHATATAFILGCIYTLFDADTHVGDWYR